MGKMFNAVILTVFIQLALILFSGSTYQLVSSNSATTNLSNVVLSNSSNQMTSYFLDPTSWTNAPLISFLFSPWGLLIGIGAVAIGYLVFRLEVLIFAPMVAVIAGFGAVTVELWSYVYSISAPLLADSCTTVGGCGPLQGLIASLLVSPLIIWYIFVCYDWWRGRD